MVKVLDDVVFDMLKGAVRDDCGDMPACGMLSDATPAQSRPKTYCPSQRMSENGTNVHLTVYMYIHCTPSALHAVPMYARVRLHYVSQRALASIPKSSRKSEM